MNLLRPANRANGFTLIELLLASIIFCLLITVLHTLLFSAMRLRETSFRSVESALPREQMAQIIRRDLTNMVPPAGVLAGALLGTPVKQSNVEQDTLAFYTTTGEVTDGKPWGDIQEVQYRLDTPTDRDAKLGMDFTREVTRNLLSPTAQDETDLSPWRLMRGVSSLQLLYWDGQEWIDTWDSTQEQNLNPTAVKLRIEFVNDPSSNQFEGPLEVTCETVAQPQATPAAASASPSPTPAKGGG